MAEEILYIKLERNVESEQKDIFLKDAAKIVCKDKQILAKAKAIKLYSFKKESDIRQVISVMKIIEMIQTHIPEISDIQNIGETDVILEKIQVDKKKDWKRIVKICFVCFVCFFGTAFTIMAYHNDIGIHKMFAKLYLMIAGKTSNGYTILEVFYSLGLSIGIVVFFNHIGPRRLTKDPTPVEVEMRLYEKDVNTSLVETANREGKTIDAS